MYDNLYGEVAGRDAWHHTVSWLQGSQLPAQRVEPALRAKPVRRLDPWQPLSDAGPTVRLLDRPTPRTVAVSWSSPGECHYGYQIWHLGPAKGRGICAVTGRAIRVGELMYSPRCEGTAPVNLGEMLAYECGQEFVPEPA